MTLDRRATTRISGALADFIGSLSENENAAMRALLLIAAVELGVDARVVATDVRSTLGASLPPHVFERLVAMLARTEDVLSVRLGDGAATNMLAPLQCSSSKPSEMSPSSVQVAASDMQKGSGQDGVQSAFDPFGSIGFDFDDAAGS